MKRTRSQIPLIVIFTLFFAVGCEDDEPGLNLSKKEWEVVSITEAGSLAPQPAKDTYKLEFINDTTYELHLDVNHCVGRYSISKEGKIDFKGAACTLICCDTEYAEKMAAMFPGMTSYRVETGYLILSGDGRIRLK